MVDVNALFVLVALVAGGFAGYQLKFFLVRRKAKMDSTIYNADGTFNAKGLIDWFKSQHPDADKIAAAVKAINEQKPPVVGPSA